MEGMSRALQELQVQYLGRVIFEKRDVLKFHDLNLHVIIVSHTCYTVFQTHSSFQ